MENYVESILKTIEGHFNEILKDDFYRDFKGKVEVSNEQLFAKKKFLSPNSIYIVVKFNNASIDLGQVLLPVTINAISEQNGVEVCQKLLFDFSERFTLNTIPDNEDFVKEVWNTPNVLNNFNEIAEGFRSLFYTTGTIIIGKNSSPLSEFKFYVDGNENNKSENNEIDLLDSVIIYAENFDIDLDPQPFYTTKGITKSKAKSGTISFNITCFKMSNDFFTLCKMIKRGKTKLAKDGVTLLGKDGINTDFKFLFKDKDDEEPWTETFKFFNSAVQQNKGDLPTISITFTR